jgi:hypothetical protein
MGETKTFEVISQKFQELTENYSKFMKGTNSAGTRARNNAQDLKVLMKTLRDEILATRNERKSDS